MTQARREIILEIASHEYGIALQKKQTELDRPLNSLEQQILANRVLSRVYASKYSDETLFLGIIEEDNICYRMRTVRIRYLYEMQEVYKNPKLHVDLLESDPFFKNMWQSPKCVAADLGGGSCSIRLNDLIEFLEVHYAKYFETDGRRRND